MEEPPEAEAPDALLLRLLGSSPPGSLRHVQPHGLPPLVYSCSVCDEELGLRLVAAQVSHDVGLDLNEAEPCSNYTPLHMCCELGLPDLARALVDAGACLQRRSTDLVQPFGRPVPGGRTPLHVAAAAGISACAEILLSAGADRLALDFDGNTPSALAAAAGRPVLAAHLAPSASEEGRGLSKAEIADKARRDQIAASARVSSGQEVSGLFAAVHTVPRVWTAEYCERLLRSVLDLACRRGWDSARHQAYPTTDIKCSDMPHEVNMEVRCKLEQSVLPEMLRLYSLGSAILRFRDLFFVAYCATNDAGLESDGQGPKPQASLTLHRDGSILSFNLLLNRASDFDGGGTFVEPLQQTFHLDQGDLFLHSGRVLHAGAEVTRGRRYLLVGFVDALNADGSHYGT